MLTVNGRDYPLWSQFVEGKERWIGGLLQDHDMGGLEPTEITDIVLEPNGQESAYFKVIGKRYSCGFDVKYGGIGGSHTAISTKLHFTGYGGSSWSIQPAGESK